MRSSLSFNHGLGIHCSRYHLRVISLCLVMVATGLASTSCAPHSYALAHGRLTRAERRLESIDPALKNEWPQKVRLIQSLIDDGHDALKPPSVDVAAARIYADIANEQLDDFRAGRVDDIEFPIQPLLSPTKPADLARTTELAAPPAAPAPSSDATTQPADTPLAP